MKNIFAIVLFFHLFNVSAQTIPVSRISDWSNSGYSEIIPSPTNILDVKQFGAAGDGITDDANAIRNAIDSLHGSRGVVYFPSGNYLVASTIDLPDSVILRGISSDSAHIIFNLNNTVGNGFNKFSWRLC